jgi:hypothetical protein
MRRGEPAASFFSALRDWMASDKRIRCCRFVIERNRQHVCGSAIATQKRGQARACPHSTPASLRAWTGRIHAVCIACILAGLTQWVPGASIDGYRDTCTVSIPPAEHAETQLGPYRLPGFTVAVVDDEGSGKRFARQGFAHRRRWAAKTIARAAGNGFVAVGAVALFRRTRGLHACFGMEISLFARWRAQLDITEFCCHGVLP